MTEQDFDQTPAPDPVAPAWIVATAELAGDRRRILRSDGRVLEWDLSPVDHAQVLKPASQVGETRFPCAGQFVTLPEFWQLVARDWGRALEASMAPCFHCGRTDGQAPHPHEVTITVSVPYLLDCWRELAGRYDEPWQALSAATDVPASVNAYCCALQQAVYDLLPGAVVRVSDTSEWLAHLYSLTVEPPEAATDAMFTAIAGVAQNVLLLGDWSR